MAAAPVPALFSPAGDAYVAAALTRGPWDARMMHGGPPSALLAHTIEQVTPGSELAVSRLTIELLGGVPLGEVSVGASLMRPGRRFQIVEGTLRVGERVACAARAVRLRREDLPDAAASSVVVEPLSRPETGEPWTYFAKLGGERFYPDGTEIIVVGGAGGSGHAVAWIRLRGELLPGVAPSALARVAAAADFSNGLSWILPFEEWLFVNTELTIHLYREPVGEWIGLDARTVTGVSGIGLASGVLHDLDGPIGMCAQSLFVQRRSVPDQS